MGKRSQAPIDYDSDGGFVEDAPKGKKAKKQVNSEVQIDDEGNPYFELSGKRRIQISEFKGNTMVSVREFYEKDSKVLPGKKGISLSLDQYKTFVSLLPDIERVLAGKGVHVPRPQYDAPARAKKSGGEDAEADEEMDASARVEKRSKPNHEATSDEDEG